IATCLAVSVVALTGILSVVPSMCQLNVPLRYSAVGLTAGSRLTLKISWPRWETTSPSLRLNASWASSSRCSPRKSSTPRHFSASAHLLMTVSSSRFSTPVTCTPRCGLSAVVSSMEISLPNERIILSFLEITEGRSANSARRARLAQLAPLAARSVVVDDGHVLCHWLALAGEHPALGDLVVVERVVHAHLDLAPGDMRDAGRAVAGLAGERRRHSRPARAFQQCLAWPARDLPPLAVQHDRDR